jgi:PIN domain nuclease of toxin-antitoxin system
MERVIRLDTHVVVWLFTGETEQLSAAAIEAIEAIEQHLLVVSPMVQLELSYLHEIGRLRVGGADIIADLENRVGPRRSDLPLDALVDTAAALTWTRYPFDRLIVADALVAGAALVTKDRSLHDHTSIARW